MQYQHIGYGIKGFYRIGSYAIKASMTHPTAKFRLGVLEFWQQHGIAAAIDHSGRSRRTLYQWRAVYRKQGITGLVPTSTAPRHRRYRQWSPQIIDQIRYLRRQLPNLGR